MNKDDKPTPGQLKTIEEIEKTSRDKFTGTTKEEAHRFIQHHKKANFGNSWLAL